MNGPVLDFDPGAVRRPAAPQGDTREAPGVLDTIVAGFDVARADTTGKVEADQVDAYRPIIDALLELEPDGSFTRYVNPSSGTVSPESVWRDVQRYRAQGRFKELPATLEEFETQWRAKRRAEIERAEDTASRGNGVAGFIGGVAGALTDPVNIYTLPVGGFGRTVTTRILTEGLVNMGVELSQQPGVQRQREELGRRDLTLEEGALNVVLAGVGASAIRGGIEAAPAIGRALNDQVIQPVRRAIDPNMDDKALARAFADQVPVHLRTPEQDAALFVINRTAEVEDASPYVRTHEAIDAHVEKMQTALDALEEGRIASAADIEAAGTVRAPVAVPGAARPVAQGFDRQGVKAAIRGPESGGNDNITNRAGSSAAGRYQFIRDTFIGLYKREYGASDAAARQAWNRNRFDVGVQERLMDRLLDDNAAALQRAGIEADDGNLYLAHFAGAGKAIELLRAPPDAPVSAFFSAKAVAQNKTYLGGGKTVAEAIATIRGKVGDPGEATPAPIDPVVYQPELRDPALDAERPTVMLNDRPIEIAAYRASQIDVDADLMQFKSGGDQFGVTDRLRTVEQWDSYQAGVVTVWEGVDGRRLIADGHQRLGLAKRIGAQSGEDIELQAYVLREADGFTAGDARRITALRNVAEGSGTKVDAAKVFRDLAPEEIEAVLARMAKGGEFIRDARGLARLDGEAFGAIVNEVLPENYGAAIGQLVDDPTLHMGMVRVLSETQPANRRQAEAIIRQALDAGFVKETQDSLFGAEDLMTGLFAQRAKLLDRALSELKRLKGAFGVAVRNADTLEAGGNKIDVAGSAAEVDANALALAMVNALALRKGNAVNALLTRSAERIAAGEKPAAVLRDFIAEIRKLDLAGIAREADDAGGSGAGDGAGRGAGDAAPEGGFLDEPGFFGRDAFDDGPSPAELDAAAAAKPRSDHTDLPPDPDPRFAEPDSDGIVAATDSAWHDIDAALKVDPNIAARQRQEAELGAAENSNVDVPIDQRVDVGAGQEWSIGAGFVPGAEGIATKYFPQRAIFQNGEAVEIQVLSGGQWISVAPRDAAKMADSFASAAEAEAAARKAFKLDADRRAKVLANREPIKAETPDQFKARIKAEKAARQQPQADADTPKIDETANPATDPNIAARQRQEAALGAAAPLRSAADQDGTIGLELFDSIDQKSLFDLGDGRGERSVADIRAEIDGDRAAIEEIKKCLF